MTDTENGRYREWEIQRMGDTENERYRGDTKGGITELLDLVLA